MREMHENSLCTCSLRCDISHATLVCVPVRRLCEHYENKKNGGFFLSRSLAHFARIVVPH